MCIFFKDFIKTLNNFFLANISCCPRRLQHNNFLSSKTSSRRFQEVFARCLPQDVFVRCLPDAFPRRLLQDVFKKTSCKHNLKTSSRHVGRQKNVTLKTSLQYGFTKTNVYWVTTYRRL